MKKVKKPVKKELNKTKKKNGRPSKKKGIDLGMLEALAGFGLTDAQIAKIFHITEQTLNNYKKDEKFFESLKRGKAISDDRVIQSLYHRATGYSHPEVDIKIFKGKIIKTEVIKHYPPDSTSMIFWLKNRKPKDWKDRQEHGGLDGGPIEAKLHIIYDDKPQKNGDG